MSTRTDLPFLESVSLTRDRVPTFDRYPFSIPAVRHLHSLALHPNVTFFIGENGTGKSTLMEAMAVVEGFNAEGGSRNFMFATKNTHSDELARCIRVARSVRRRDRSDSFFLRAESFYNVATYLDEIGVRYGDVSLHAQSHGESFLTLFVERFGGNGVYLLDEPEAALSPQRQLAFLAQVHQLVVRGSQFVIATHSPIIMAYPRATIYQFSENGIAAVAYEETEHYRVSKLFLTRTEKMLADLMSDEPE